MDARVSFLSRLGTVAPGVAGVLAATTLLLLPLLGGCSNKQRLAEYDYRGRTLGLVTIAPAHPELLTGMDIDIDTDNPLGTLIRAGAEIARETSAADTRARLDSAARTVEVSDRMGGRVLGDVSRYLRTRPVEDLETGAREAVDFELEIRVDRYGIVADSWT
ncbi:MAG: hypothetical protein ACODAE_09295, partial [Gemmatimonadota bacterium]